MWTLFCFHLGGVRRSSFMSPTTAHPGSILGSCMGSDWFFWVWTQGGGGSSRFSGFPSSYKSTFTPKSVLSSIFKITIIWHLLFFSHSSQGKSKLFKNYVSLACCSVGVIWTAMQRSGGRWISFIEYHWLQRLQQKSITSQSTAWVVHVHE